MRRGSATITEITFPGLEEQLKHLAQTDWEKFSQLVQLDKVQIFVCVERARGKSLQQIANKLKVTKGAVRKRCMACSGPTQGQSTTPPPAATE